MASSTSFTISAQANTDIWKKPPTHDVFTAPYKPHSSKPLAQFISATITFTTTYTLQFDQAGILLKFTKPGSPSTPRKWIKAGIELFNDQPRLSTVCCDSWADWSVASATHADEIRAGKRSVTLLVEREAGGLGSCLWIYQIDGETKVPLREICWVYGDHLGEGWEVEVSGAVARPAKEADGSLEAKFQDFDVKWAEQ